MAIHTTLLYQTAAVVQVVDMIQVMPIWTLTVTTHPTMLATPMRHTSTHIVPFLETPCELTGKLWTTTTA